MKKLLFVSLFFIANVNSDIDLGEDFAPGDLVTADAFNTKFNALNGVVGEIVDADLLGNWECTSYKDFADSSHLAENGGNGQVGSGSFYSNTGTLSLTENDTESSLNSPKIWSIDRDDVIFDNEEIEEDSVNLNSGTYSLLGNTLYFFLISTQIIVGDQTSVPFNIKLLSETKIYLSPNPKSVNLGYPNPNVICEIIPGSESE